MRQVKSKHGILDVLFPAVRARLLRLLFAAPPRPHYVRELRDLSGLTLHTVQDELRKLIALGLLESWSNGYHRFYKANRGHPLSSHLFRMVQLNDELPAVKHSALRRPPGRSTSRRKLRVKTSHLPPDRPLSWKVSSPLQKRTRRL
jgi:predicted transcriptional regulator